MKVLFVSWELDPFFKVGGLGDVARSLPASLKSLGVDIRNIIPYYKSLKLAHEDIEKIGQYDMEYANRKEKIEIFSVQNSTIGVKVYFLKNKKYLDIPKSSDTFSFFDKAVVIMVKNNILQWQPDIIHCNDHHTGFIPLIIKECELPIKTVFTVHNLAYQGRSSIDVINNLGLDLSKCKMLQWEIKERQVNFLLEGITHANIITTVSPTYGREIMTEEFGVGLDEYMRGRAGRVFGILNGLDVDYQYSSHMQDISYPYRSNQSEGHATQKLYSWKDGKRLNKMAFQKKLGLSVDDTVPVFSFIGRLDGNQKGLDILHRMMRNIDVEQYQFIILGTGSQEWEERFNWLSTFYSNNFSCNFQFDSKLANMIYASSDYVIIPSRFEPCGLVQMLGMFYGTPPIAHKTGGLADSINDGKNGFLFNHYTSESLLEKVKFARDIWKNDRPRYDMMVEAAISTDFSWQRSAKEYIDLYSKLLSGYFS